MVPFPNVIAGILIGITNDSWFARIIVPFVWGIVFCIYVSVFRRDRRDAYITNAILREVKAKWGMSHIQAFYFIEYMTAVSTSLFFSIISGFIRGIF